MINLSEIKKQFPDNLPEQDRHILREYMQYQILNLIFKQKIATKLSFLGGTAIKICYGSQRYSEDLDFDNFQLTQTEFEQLIKKLVNDLQNEGYSVEYRLVYKGAFRCYLKFIDLL
jgi:predicted nucleotidyltransferase component of viral defense system